MGGASSHLVESLGYQVPNSETDTSSFIIRNSRFPDELVWKPLRTEPSVDTCWRVVERGFAKFKDLPMLGNRAYLADGKRGDYQFETYGKVGEIVTKIGAGLAARGLAKGDPLAIFGINSDSWVKCLAAAWRQGLTCVPLYDTLGASATEYILKDASVKVVCCAKCKVEQLLTVCTDYKLQTIVQFESDIEESAATAASEAGIELVSLESIMSADPVEPTFGDSDSLAYTMYTSGTTGNPKGVNLTHKNVLASVAGLIFAGIQLTHEDVYMSYLPLAHSFETCMMVLGLCFGARVGFYQGNVKLLTDDIATLRPTVFAGVPRVYSRIYDKVQAAIAESGGMKQSLFHKAFENQLENVKQGHRNGFWDSLVFNKVKQRLGGRIRMMATGAAPMPAHIMDFLKVAFACDVFQGYGMTENAAAACVTPAMYPVPGTVGEPLPCCEVRLDDCPELNYTHKDQPNPRGEICLRGHNVFAGYHHLPEKTAETLDEDGWLHTGDIGQILPDGAIQIIDRKKNIFKLAQGEYVAAEELENIFSRSRFVGQIFVYGNSFHVSLIAIIVPDLETTTSWAQDKGMSGTFQEVVATDEFKALIKQELEECAKEDKLPGFKKIKDFHLESNVNDLMQGFSVENDCLTPTFKLKRKQLQERYQAQIDAMYAAQS